MSCQRSQAKWKVKVELPGSVVVEIVEGDVHLDAKYDLRTLKRVLRALKAAEGGGELAARVLEEQWLRVVEDDATSTNATDVLHVSGA